MPLQFEVDEYDGVGISLHECMLGVWHLRFDRPTVTWNTCSLNERLAAGIAAWLARRLSEDLQRPTEKNCNMPTRLRAGWTRRWAEMNCATRDRWLNSANHVVPSIGATDTRDLVSR